MNGSDYESVSDLRVHFNALLSARDTVVSAVIADDLPVYFPSEYTNTREMAARALTLMWFDDNAYAVPYGCICVSPETEHALRDFIATKEAFKSHLDWYKATFGATMRSRARHPDLSKHLNSIGLGRLNLLWCFRKISLLGDQIRQISWVRCSSIKAITPLDLSDAQKVTTLLPDEARETASAIIGQQRASSEFAIVKPVAAHWRANVVYNDGHVPARKMIYAGSPLVCTSPQLPVIRVSNLEEQKGRKPRLDRVLPDDALVNCMNLFCYPTGTGKHVKKRSKIVPAT